MTRIASFISIAVAVLMAAPLSADPPTKKPTPDKSSAKAGEKSSEAKPRDDKKPGAARNVNVVDRERLAREFAERHHPELGDLLAMLQPMNPDAYDAAIRDISRVAERLEPIQARDPERYRRELDVWKTRSRVHVVSAEYRLAPNPELEKRLRSLMEEQVRAKREALRYEREKAERRVDEIDRELRKLEQEGQADVDRAIERLSKPSPARKDKPADVKPKGS